MKNLWVLLLVLFFSAAVSAQTKKKDKSSCDVVNGKSYLGGNGGTFDATPDTVNSHKIVFDVSGKGTTREFFVLDTKSVAGRQTRTMLSKVNSAKRDVLFGKSYLQFSDGSTLYITWYDNGSKIWGEVTTEGRKTKG